MECFTICNVRVYMFKLLRENTMIRRTITRTLFLFAMMGAFSCTAPSAANADASGSTYNIKIKKNDNKKEPVATIEVNGKAGFHCNTLYPWKLTVKPGPGAGVEPQILKKKDAKKFAKDAVIFKVSYKKDPNKKTSADLKFSMCNDKQCVMETIPLSW